MANNAQAYGFTAYRHLAGQRLTGIGTATVWKMVTDSLVHHTDQMNAIFRWGIERTVLYSKRQPLTSDGTLQPLDEQGNPLPVSEEGYFDVAWPIQRAGTAFGTTLESRALMTFEELNRLTIAAMRRDGDWVKKRFMAAFFDNSTWSYTDPAHGVLTIRGLANGDVDYPVVGGGVVASQHYLAQAAAIADGADNPYPAIYTLLRSHPSNIEPYICYIATDLVSDTVGLTDFTAIPDPDLVVGNAATRIGASPALIAQVRAFGDEVLGKVDNLWIVEWKGLPSNYMICHAQGAGPFVGMREQDDASLQGFFTQAPDVKDGNLNQINMRRIAGFGAWNRIAAAVQYVGDGDYAIPSGYDPAV